MRSQPRHRREGGKVLDRDRQPQFRHRGQPADPLRVSEELGRGHVEPFDEAAAEGLHAADAGDAAMLAVLGQYRQQSARRDGRAFGRRMAGLLDLHADELGPRRIAVLVEPVGVDEPRRVVVRGGDDRLRGKASPSITAAPSARRSRTCG